MDAFEPNKQRTKSFQKNMLNNYIIAIYNSPYQLLNRKNEIWIEVNKDQVQKKLDI